MEQITGLEPATQPWKGWMLPLHYICILIMLVSNSLYFSTHTLSSTLLLLSPKCTGEAQKIYLCLLEERPRIFKCSRQHRDYLTLQSPLKICDAFFDYGVITKYISSFIQDTCFDPGWARTITTTITRPLVLPKLNY